MGVSVMRLCQLLFITIVLQIGNATMRQDELDIQVLPNPSLKSKSMCRGSNCYIQNQEDAGEALIMKVFHLDNEKLEENMKEYPPQIPIGWKDWEERNYLHKLMHQRHRGWSIIVKRGKGVRNWSLNKTLKMLPTIPMNIKIPSEIFILAPNLSKSYKSLGEENREMSSDMEQIIDMINVQMNDNNSDLHNDRNTLKIPYKRTIQDLSQSKFVSKRSFYTFQDSLKALLNILQA